jgi:hypothetical protein
VGSTFEGRPLFAYTHVGTGWSLGLSIKRHAPSEVLSAVVERLHVESSAGPDGTSRHTATFDVRCLKTQFFALRLPAGAKLWSVVVNGVGVKPASRDGVEIIPMPAPDPNRAQDTLAVTYTLAGDAWGARSVQDLVAPELMFDAEKAVPVLRTSWALALPGDYRVLQWSGNLAGAKAASATPIGLALWRDVRDAGGAWLLALALAGLVVAASPRLQSGLVSGLAGASAAGGVAGHGVASVAGNRRVWEAAAVLTIVGALGAFCVSGLSTAKHKRTIQGTDGNWGDTGGAPGSAPMPDAPFTPVPAGSARYADEFSASADQKVRARGDESNVADAPADLDTTTTESLAPQGQETGARRDAEKPSAPPPAPPPPPVVANASPPQPRPARAPAGPANRRGGRDGPAEGGEEPMPVEAPAPMEPSPEPQAAPGGAKQESDEREVDVVTGRLTVLEKVDAAKDGDDRNEPTSDPAAPPKAPDTGDTRLQAIDKGTTFEFDQTKAPPPEVVDVGRSMTQTTYHPTLIMGTHPDHPEILAIVLWEMPIGYTSL